MEVSEWKERKRAHYLVRQMAELGLRGPWFELWGLLAA
jgi:hypothetical protein